MKERSVRELGGEIWAEFVQRENLGMPYTADSDTVGIDTMNNMIDIIMGVLARNDGAIIVIDRDLPVEPLRRLFDS